MQSARSEGSSVIQREPHALAGGLSIWRLSSLMLMQAWQMTRLWTSDQAGWLPVWHLSSLISMQAWQMTRLWTSDQAGWLSVWHSSSLLWMQVWRMTRLSTSDHQRTSPTWSSQSGGRRMPTSLQRVCTLFPQRSMLPRSTNPSMLI